MGKGKQIKYLFNNNSCTRGVNVVLSAFHKAFYIYNPGKQLYYNNTIYYNVLIKLCLRINIKNNFL